MNIKTPEENSLEKSLYQKEKYCVFRPPKLQDGHNIHHLISHCSPLDENSPYCNFLQASLFNQSSILAESKGQTVGFISGMLNPDRPHSLFIWQVAVSPEMRAEGLAYSMLKSLLDRKNLQFIEVVETTITQSNTPSWALFKKIDLLYGNHGSVRLFLDKEAHFKGKQETEYLYRIPLKTQP